MFVIQISELKSYTWLVHALYTNHLIGFSGCLLDLDRSMPSSTELGRPIWGSFKPQLGRMGAGLPPQHPWAPFIALTKRGTLILERTFLFVNPIHLSLVFLLKVDC